MNEGVVIGYCQALYQDMPAQTEKTYRRISQGSQLPQILNQVTLECESHGYCYAYEEGKLEETEHVQGMGQCFWLNKFYQLRNLYSIKWNLNTDDDLGKM